MKKIKKFRTTFPHHTALHFLIWYLLEGMKKRYKACLSNFVALYPGSESNRYGRNGHRILSPYYTAGIPIKPPEYTLHFDAKWYISALHFRTPSALHFFTQKH